MEDSNDLCETKDLLLSGERKQRLPNYIFPVAGHGAIHSLQLYRLYQVTPGGAGCCPTQASAEFFAFFFLLSFSRLVGWTRDGRSWSNA